MMSINWHMVWHLTIATMKARYRQTFAGLVWVVLNPIIMFTAHAIIFKMVLKINIPNYFLFLMGGLLPWSFITSTIAMTNNVFVTSADLLRSFNLSPPVLFLSKVFDNFINFLLAFMFLFLILLLFQGHFQWFGVLMLPAAIVLLLVNISALCLLLALIQVFFRDAIYVNQFVINVSYLMTPIFYPVSMIPENFRFLVHLNPFYAMIAPFQVCLWNFEMNHFLSTCLQSGIWGCLWIVILVFYWKRKHHEFYLRL